MRACLLALVCILLALPVLALPIQNADQAVKSVESNILPGLKDQVVMQVWGPVAAGTDIRGTKERILVAPGEGYVIYIDDYPTANLFHPVRYAFVESATGSITMFPAKSPPQNQEEYTQVSTAIGDILMATENHRAEITEPPGGPGPTRGDRWAVLMNGGYNSSNNHVRYWNDLSNIYITLTTVYGFADDHIIVLCSDGTNPAVDQSNGQNSNPDLDGDGDADIMYSCVLSNVDMVFGQLAGILTPNDKLFIFTTDHGGPVSGPSVIENLWNQEELPDTHFAQLLAALPRCEIICTLEPCNSGGFLDNIVVSPGPIVASSACRYDESSWAMPPDYVYDTYVFHWTAAVKGRDAYGVVVNGDYNADGVITMDEAYRYAIEHDTDNEHPQYGDFPVGFGVGVSLWPTGTGPFVVIADKVIDDIGGNNNNAPDPGESCSMVVTLNNVGQGQATNIVGSLSTTDPYLTITQNTANFPNLGHFQQGQGTPAYTFNVSSTCPQGQNVTCLLHITADSAYTNEANITFVVGDPLNSPSGPDAYGYRAYDPYDTPELPAYNWVEISADSGGAGTMVAFTSDDQVFSYDLPFSFVYYGQTFSRYSVGANGWVAMGDVLADDYSNSGIPNTDGPEAMIAGYWEDLSPQRTNSGKVWSWFDATNHRLIVEYNHIEQFAPVGAFETFQIILLDPVYYPTSTGDGRIKVQYKDMSASAQTEGTIGIDNPAETVGIQYFFDGARDANAHAITNRFSILYTTATGVPPVVWDITTSAVNPPVVIPANGGSFPYNINVHNLTTTPQTGSVWNKVRNSAGQYTQIFGPVTRTLGGGANPSRVMTQTIAGSISSGTLYFISYMGTYPNTISDSSFFTITKSTVADGNPWISESFVTGDFFDEFAVTNSSMPTEYSLNQNYPNPFNPLTSISFNLPQAGLVKLTVFDIMGREVAQLVNGMRDAGTHSVTFDATHLASGIYLYKLEAGEYSATNKMVLMK
ncbi:MAG: T9SS type A sorting domain-containing protein [bacterium]|nr:T9SS type A sorting domain-containing protein [bacterium]